MARPLRAQRDLARPIVSNAMTVDARSFSPAGPAAKTSRDENFPVGSWLIAAPLRPHIAAFYAFARAADDVADDPALTSRVKLSRLDCFAEDLDGRPAVPAEAARMRVSFAATAVSPRHGHDLLDAFRQDATKSRYADWTELLGYCDRSAAPVGRYLLDLHGEDRGLWPAADALCNALQILNHVQDCREDCEQLDRVYLPQDWLREAGASEMDLRDRATPAIRAVLDRVLDGVDGLLAKAAGLPKGLRSRRLAMESAVILRLARRLARRLRRHDPIMTKVRLTGADFLAAGLGGVAAGLFRR